MERKSALRFPAVFQIICLALQVVYAILFVFDIGDFKDCLLHYFEAMILFILSSALLGFIFYWIAFFRQSVLHRIVFALLLLLHLTIAYFNFYITIVTTISRC